MPSDEFLNDDFGGFDKEPEPLSAPAPEMSDLLKKLKAGARAEKDVFMENTDSEYWVALCFQTRAQKEEFLTKMGWLELGDKYLDGVEVAAKQGIKLENKTPKIRKRTISKRWKEFVK